MKGKRYIEFDIPIVPFLQKYRGILVPSIHYMLTRYLEKINFSPRIAEKVRGIPPREYLSKEEKILLRRFHKNDGCFYCGKRVEKYVDEHVIPFDYIFFD